MFVYKSYIQASAHKKIHVQQSLSFPEKVPGQINDVTIHRGNFQSEVF